MKNQVKVVAHPETGAVITINADKPEEGTMRVDQSVVSMEGGYLNKRTRTAFINGKVKDLKELGLKDGSTIDGKIVYSETFEPMYAKHKVKINPTTKEEVLVNGKNVYLEATFTANLSAQDSLVRATSVVAEAVSAGLAD